MPYKNSRRAIEVEIWEAKHFPEKDILIGRHSSVNSGHRMEMWDPDNPKFINAYVDMEITE